MKKRILALFTCLALCLSLLPTAALAQGGNTLTVGGDGTGATYKYLTDALNAAQPGDTIRFLGNAGAFSESKEDEPLVIDKQVTIDGNGHTLTVRYAGILLGADVTINGLTISMTSTFGNAIYANGHRLTLNQVRNEQATGATANVIHLFSGGAMNAGWDGRANGGSHGQIIIRGSDNRLGDIFAGNWSRTNEESIYSGSSTITIEESAGGTIGNIYACGAYEPTGTGNSNDILPNSDKFPVTGEVTINLSNGAVGTVYGETGGSSNAKVVYNSSISDARSSRLEDIASLEVKKGYFAPGKANAMSNLDDTAVTIRSGARLDLRNVSSPIAPASWSGDGGVLEIGTAQTLYLTGAVTGTTTVAIGGWNSYTNLAWEAATADHLYIQAGQAQGGEFTFLPKTAGGTAPEWSAADKGWQLASSGSGGGTKPTGPVKPSSFRFVNNVINRTTDEIKDKRGVEVSIEAPIPDGQFIFLVPFTVQIQKDGGEVKTAYREYDGRYGYSYSSTILGITDMFAIDAQGDDTYPVFHIGLQNPGSYKFTVSVETESGTTATDTLTLNITDPSTPPDPGPGDSDPSAKIPEAVMQQVTAYTGEYNGQSHNAVLLGSVDASLYDVTYTAQGAPATTVCPTILEAGELPVEVKVALKSDASVFATKTVKAVVTAKPVTVTGLQAVSRIYNGSNMVELVGGTVDGAIVNDDVRVDLSGAVGKMADANAGDNKAVTVTGVKLAGARAGSYSLTGVNPVTVDIGKDVYTPAPLAGSAKYGSSGTVQLTAVLVAGARVDAVDVTAGKALLNGEPTVSGDSLHFAFQNNATVGETAIVRVVVASDNYEEYEIVVTLTVGSKETQSAFGFAAPAQTKTYGDAPFTVPATGAAAGSNVTYESSAPEVAVVDQTTGQVTIRKVGEAVITANAAETAEYVAASASYRLTVNKAAVTVAAKSQSIYVGDSIPDLTNPVLNTHYTISGLVGGDTLGGVPVMAYQTGGTAVMPDTSKSGSYDIVIVSAADGNGNYAVTYQPATLTIADRPTTSGGGTGGGGTGGGGTGGGGGGGTGGGTTTTTDTTQQNADGSTTTIKTDAATGTVTETTKYADGSTVTMETKKDGSTTETRETAMGVAGTTVTDKNGAVTEVSAKVSTAAVQAAEQTGRPVTLPVQAEAARQGGQAAAVKVDAPTGNVAVEIPTKNLTVGTVAVLVSADGTETLVKKSAVSENGVVLTLNGAATVKLVDNSRQFDDVPAASWANNAVTFVAAREIFSGTSETSFAPEQPMTRGMLAKVLHNLENNPTAGVAGGFADVAAGAWYADAVDWAVGRNIVSGYGDGSFGAEDSITREQLAVMLWRYAGSPASAHTLDGFRDTNQISEYAQQALAWANENGIMSGKGEGILDPQGTATRAQVAQMLMQLVDSQQG
ncbi:MAG: S-layer homology domain-containing protein [Agathobaculum sp.]|uniref:S-layer homology domain-containing protein n=1 Tax=Agathobaculum sp. TaxID=2048138 RepID=UPI002A814626|nr:S-layer homology domain-containing protein [Agathobaculum sp.]MDY3711551.1 S-layer homology domain-containing protein [Agathobaculum sp.]